MIGFETQPLGMCFDFLKEGDNSNSDNKTEAYQGEEDIESSKSDDVKSKKNIYLYIFSFLNLIFNQFHCGDY